MMRSSRTGRDRGGQGGEQDEGETIPLFKEVEHSLMWLHGWLIPFPLHGTDVTWASHRDGERWCSGVVRWGHYPGKLGVINSIRFLSLRSKHLLSPYCSSLRDTIMCCNGVPRQGKVEGHDWQCSCSVGSWCASDAHIIGEIGVKTIFLFSKVYFAFYSTFWLDLALKLNH